MNKIIISALVATLSLASLTGCNTGEATGHTTKTTPTAHPSGPSAKFSGTCDTDLGSADGSDYGLNAEVRVKNTGDGNAKVTVVVSFPQYGHKAINGTKTVVVAKGKAKTVNLSKHVTQAQFSRAQDYQLKHDGVLKCKYSGTAKAA